MTTENGESLKDRIAKIQTGVTDEEEPTEEVEPTEEIVEPWPGQEEIPPEEVPGEPPEREPPGGEGEEVPVYLQDEPPEGKSNYTKWALMHGVSEEQLIDEGVNANTVRICAQELEKDGYRQRPSKSGTRSTAVAKRGATGEIQTFAKGSPPEALINAIELPLNTPDAKIFEKGLKTGAALLVLGVRVAQELSSVGIQQAKPIMDMARSMREGEALAAKNAATEAANEAAMNVSKVFSPHLASLEDTIGDLRKGGQDPVQAMMVRTMEPMFQQMMKMFMPNVQMPPPGGAPDWKVVNE